jgi:tetratricopeptide (TPR) repeat protein
MGRSIRMSQHPNVALRLNILAALFQDANRLAEAEALYRRALAITEKSFGPNHPHIASVLNNLAPLLKDTNRLRDAETFLRRALSIHEKSLGPDHPEVATNLNNLAELYRAQSRDAEAQPPLERALSILEKSLGQEHPHVATSLNNLAQLYRAQGQYDKAEPLFRRALDILIRRSDAQQSPHLRHVTRKYAALVCGVGISRIRLDKGRSAKFRLSSGGVKFSVRSGEFAETPSFAMASCAVLVSCRFHGVPGCVAAIDKGSDFASGLAFASDAGSSAGASCAFEEGGTPGFE